MLILTKFKKSHCYGFFVDCPENKISPPRFTDLVTTMSVVSRACSFNSRTDVLLEILKEMYCLFYLPIKTAETRSSQLAFYFLYSKCKEKPYPWKETRIVVLNLSQPYSAWTFFELLSLGGGGHKTVDLQKYKKLLR